MFSLKKRKGASTTEMGLLVGLIAVAIILSVSSTGDEIKELFGKTSESMNQASKAGQSDNSGGSGASDEVPLYNFSSHTFSNCGQTGRTGPNISQCRGAYSTDWDENTDYFAIGSGIQLWTVPATATYKITVSGAQGGGSGRPGATVSGDFQLTKGQKIQILVGQQGIGNGGPHGNEWGGGGGSFVTEQDDTPLIIAGGGGGGVSNSYGRSCGRDTNAGNGQAGSSTASFTCSSSTSVRTNGQGGQVSSSFCGGAGGGLTGTGANGRANCNTPPGGASFTAGGVGGNATSCYNTATHNFSNPDGGFGGGGAGEIGGSGGGGGYAGGSVACNWSSYSTYGGGGSSFNSGTNQTASAGANSGHGSVNIVKQ